MYVWDINEKLDIFDNEILFLKLNPYFWLLKFFLSMYKQNILCMNRHESETFSILYNFVLYNAFLTFLDRALPNSPVDVWRTQFVSLVSMICFYTTTHQEFS